MAENNTERKCKGWAVSLGYRVKDADGNFALFEELSSSPAAMSAGKLADVYGCFKGHVLETADGEQAYPQASMASPVRTWVRLPKAQWTSWWTDPTRGCPMQDPVVEMKQALYGHPDAGGYWERHCNRGVKAAGFRPVGQCGEWRSCYFNPKVEGVVCHLRR